MQPLDENFSALIKAYNNGEDVFEQMKAILMDSQANVEQHVLIMFTVADKKDLRFLPVLLAILNNTIDDYKSSNYRTSPKLKWLVAGFDFIGVLSYAFNQFEDNSSTDALIECLDVDEFAVEAILALAKIGTDYAFQRLLYRLGRGFAWWDEYAIGRNALIDAVASFGAKAYEPLIAILEDKEEDRYRRRDAVKALCKLDDKRVVDDFLRIWEDTELSKILIDNSVMYDIHLLNDSRLLKPVIRKIVSGELHSSRCQAAFTAFGTSKELITLLYHSNQDIQRLAIHALGEQRAKEAVSPLLALKADSPIQLHIAIRTALDKINNV